MLIALVNLLTNYFNATYELVEPRDGGGWGVVGGGPRNSSGAIGCVLRRQADLVPFVGQTGRRSEMVGFTIPIFSESVAILSRAPRIQRSPFIFLRPFNNDLWLALLGIAPLVAIALYCIDQQAVKIENTRNQPPGGGININTTNERPIPFGESLWFTYGALLNQGGAHVHGAHSSRLLVAFWWFFVIVVIATYIGNLIGLLAFPEQRWPISDIEDLAAHDGPKIYLVKGSVVHQQVLEMSNSLMAPIADRLRNGQNVELVSRSEVDIDAIARGDAVFIDHEGNHDSRYTIAFKS